MALMGHGIHVVFTAPSGRTPAKPAPDLELTFGTEPLEAWRVWTIRDWTLRDRSIEPRLAPLSADLVWQPRRRVEAVCNYGGLFRPHSGNHAAPWPTCDCGLWALRERQRVEELARDERASRARVFVFGKVALWGRVLEFEDGFRAEYGYPADLYVYDDAELADDLARIYGVRARAIASPESAVRTTRRLTVTNPYAGARPTAIHTDEVVQDFEAFAAALHRRSNAKTTGERIDELLGAAGWQA